jgi:hypothetical protein
MIEAKTLKRCIDEARRFIRLAEAVHIEHVPAHGSPSGTVAAYDRIEAGKKSAAAKRSSMDLSMCLSDLRQGR